MLAALACALAATPPPPSPPPEPSEEAELAGAIVGGVFSVIVMACICACVFQLVSADAPDPLAGQLAQRQQQPTVYLVAPQPGGGAAPMFVPGPVAPEDRLDNAPEEARAPLVAEEE